jgi:hypothetical protein
MDLMLRRLFGLGRLRFRQFDVSLSRQSLRFSPGSFHEWELVVDEVALKQVLSKVPSVFPF